MYKRRIEHVLVVDDDERVLRSIKRIFDVLHVPAFFAGDLREATTLLNEHRVDLVLSDYKLQDGHTAKDVLAIALKKQPVPLFVVMSGEATPEIAFRMGSAGAVAYLEKPVSQDKLLKLFEDAKAFRVDPTLLAASCVGNMSVRDLYGRFRDVMTSQAMALTDRNKTHAAAMLGVRRQSLLQGKGAKRVLHS